MCHYSIKDCITEEELDILNAKKQGWQEKKSLTSDDFEKMVTLLLEIPFSPFKY